MADNYLEKKMEEHRSRGHIAPARHSQSTTRGFTFPERRILVALPCLGIATAIVESLRSAGHRVAIIDTGAAKMAQSCGARCYPWGLDRLEGAVADITKHWGGVDFIVTAAPQEHIIIQNNIIGKSFHLPADADCAAAVTLLTHPLIHRLETLNRE